MSQLIPSTTNHHRSGGADQRRCGVELLFARDKDPCFPRAVRVAGSRNRVAMRAGSVSGEVMIPEGESDGMLSSDGSVQFESGDLEAAERSIKSWWNNMSGSNIANRKAMATLTMLVNWILWNERNTWVFRNKFMPPPYILELIKSEAKLWIIARAKHLRNIMPGE